VSTTELNELEDVLSRVLTWTPEMRLRLAEQMLRSLQTDVMPSGLRGVPAELVQGIAASDGPPPDDETVRRWIDAHLTEKYAP
jgi:hypothetical protein